MTTEQDKDTQLQEIGRCAFDSIAEMVAALECDYDRLDELREERDAYERPEDGEIVGTVAEMWAADNPEDAEELKELEEAAGECKDREEAEQRIHEDPLSLQIRSGWTSPGEDMVPEEFELLLGTGGPAVRIIGELDQHLEPCRARLQAQDWFTQWTDYRGGDQDTLLTYCRCFSFNV